MTQASISVEFGTTGTSTDKYYSLDVDSDYFETVNGVDKTTYSPDDEVFLRLIPSTTEENYSLSASFGSLSVVNIEVSFSIEENIKFINSTEESLSYTPLSTPSYSWSTTSKGAPTFSGKQITMTSETLGVLKVEYEAKGDRLSLTGCDTADEDEFEVICVAEYDSGEIVDTTVSFDDSDDSDGGPGTPKDVILVIKDVITDEVIPGATVTIGEIVGTADSNGEFFVQNLITGNTYDIVISAPGYFASGEDYLNNDTFTVPEDE